MKNDNYTTTRQSWNGIEIEVRYSPDWLHYDDGTGMGHLQIQSVSPKDAPLPITETGFRSHFIQPDEIAEYGGPDEYVRIWLEQEAKTKAWLVADMERRQLSLFA